MIADRIFAKLVNDGKIPKIRTGKSWAYQLKKLEIYKEKKMIHQMVNWLVENREWVFSGIGVTVLLGIIGLFKKKGNKEKDTKGYIRIEQKNEGTHNTQIGIQNNYYGGNKDDR